MPRRAALAATCLFALVTTAFLGITILNAFRWQESVQTQQAPTVQAVILTVDEKEQRSRTQTVLVADYTARTDDGTVTAIRSNQAADFDLVGQTVPVHLNRSNPAKAEFPGQPVHSLDGPVVTSIVAIIPAGLTLMFALRARQAKHADS